MSGSQRKVSVACRNTVVSPSRIETTSGLTTTLVTGRSQAPPPRPRHPCEAIPIDDAVQVGQVGDLEPTEEVAGIRDHLEHVGSVHGHGIGTRPSVPEERMAEREQEVVAHHGRRSHTRDREISDADRAGDRVTGGERIRGERAETRGLRNGTG